MLVLAAVLWLGFGGTKDKLLAVGLDSNRADIRGTTYQMIGDSALFGAGAGTYQWQFPSYKDEKFGLWLYDHAHNDYLELLSDQGAIGFALFIVAVILMLERAMRGYRVRRNRFVRGVLFGVLVGAMSFLVQAWVDFNFQIPANAVYFFVLLSLGVVAARLEEQTGDRNW